MAPANIEDLNTLVGLFDQLDEAFPTGNSAQPRNHRLANEPGPGRDAH